MGQLDQFAKQTFAEETRTVTHGALDWLPPPEIGLSEVRLDGLLQVIDPAGLFAVAAPWSAAQGHDEIVLEIKMQGDHLDFGAIERALLRRQARQVQRAEDESAPWQAQEAIWMVAARKPAVLAEGRDVQRIAPGCYRVGPGVFDFLWIAANELPLADELVPFLVARTGRALEEFARWIAPRRSPEWLLRMIQMVPMSITVSDELSKYFIQTDEPEIRARQRRIFRNIMNADPELREEMVKEGLAPLLHQLERKLGRRLDGDEHRLLLEHLSRVGPDRLGDVVLDLDTAALAAWLADPAAQ